MKAPIIQYAAIAVCLTAVSCSTTAPGPITTAPSPCIIAPDRDGNARISLDIDIPANYINKRMRLYITPQLITDGSVKETFEPVVVEGNIFHKKSIRETVLEGRNDKYASTATVINTSRPYRVRFERSVVLPFSVETARVTGLVSSEGCSKCRTYDEIDLAALATPLTLLPSPQLRTSFDETTLEIAPKVFNGHEEANLQFEINKADIDLDLGSNRSELERVRTKLTPVVKDPYSTVNSLRITGMASADGPLKKNTQLAQDRASAASDWLSTAINFPASVRRKIRVHSRPEGWEPVLKAMQEEGDPDAVKVEKILEKYAEENDDVAEKYIRALPSWKYIADNYLAKDRKVEFEYSYTIKSFTTDKELCDIYKRRPELLSEAEFLKMAAIRAENPDSLTDIYRTAVKYYPKSAVAVNNLGQLYLGDEEFAKARKVLSAFRNPTPQMLNNLAVAEAGLGNNTTAIGILSDLDSEEARYNLGVLQAQERNIDEAYTLLSPFDDINTAIVALAVNENREAYDIMKNVDDDSPLAEYVRALASARLGLDEEFFRHIAAASAEERFFYRAQSEPDFIRFGSDPRFMELFPKNTKAN